MTFLTQFSGPPLRSLFWLVILVDVIFCDPVTSDSPIYHNQFAVLIPKGPQTADQVAEAHGFKNLGQIGALDNYFLFENSRIQKRSTELSDFHGDMLAVEPDVAW
jgi:proprotein convertase subtilisin/kexin type 6